MNVGVSSHASLVKDRDMPISLSSNEEDTKDKIIKDAEDSHPSAVYLMAYPFFSRKSPKETLVICCLCIL